MNVAELPCVTVEQVSALRKAVIELEKAVAEFRETKTTGVMYRMFDLLPDENTQIEK